jgi:hypothetical protein
VNIYPGAEQHGVGADLHGAMVVAHGKLMEMEMRSALR